MAIYHLSHRFLKRGNGASSVAKAAYNSGKKIEDNVGSTAFSDYTRKGGILYDEIFLPSGTPQWANNRGELWRRLESREDRSTRRADAILAHNFDLALPHELTLEQNIFLMKDFVREQFIRKGYAVDWALHAPDPRGDDRNFHSHVLVPLRRIDGQSFGNKARYSRIDLRQQNIVWREAWEKLVNRHLARYGHKAKIDSRSLRDQGSKRKPSKHHGVRSKAKRSSLDSIRSPMPKAPVVRISKTTSADGTITVKATIKHSGLNNIGQPEPRRQQWQNRRQGSGTRIHT